jgi:hypothetical protein
MGQNFRSADGRDDSAVVVAGDLSKLAEQNQDQDDNYHETESTAPIVAGPIEGSAADTAEPT